MTLPNVNSSKRLMLIYAVVFLWLGMGVLGAFYETSYSQLAVYFLALTGFVASYIWGESVRPARSTSVFRKGRSSSREMLIYLCVLLWAGVGALGVIKKASLEELAAYYSALTPFVGAYILGVSYAPASENKASEGGV
jgi:hypothetical protein